MSDQQKAETIVRNAKRDLQGFTTFEIKLAIAEVCKKVRPDSDKFNVHMLMLQTMLNEYGTRLEEG